MVLDAQQADLRGERAGDGLVFAVDCVSAGARRGQVVDALEVTVFPVDLAEGVRRRRRGFRYGWG